MTRILRNALLVTLTAGALAGCTALVAGTAGGVIADEAINENDGQFDPGENTEIGRKIYN